MQEPSIPAAELTLDLVKRINEGDAQAWNSLWHRVHDDLLFVVRCRLGAELRRRLDSEDILQSVALEALQELPDFVPENARSLRHFLHLLVTRKIQDRSRFFGALKRRDAPTPVDVDELSVSPPGYRDPDRYLPLERALKALPEEMREVILLHRIDGLPSREVAERTGRTDVAIRKLYSRALARIRSSLPEPEG